VHWRVSTPTRVFLALSGLLLVSGCTKFRHLEYASFIRELDGLSELEISTYPADFPNRLSDKGNLLQKYETAGELYFQVHIRDKKTKSGPNPHVRSINIHSFSYQVGDAPPVVLLSGYEDNFWMQNNPRYEQRELPAVPYVPDGKVSIEISFTLNGEPFVFEGDMPAVEKSRLYPTIIVNQGI
jgi:hypothetical protein